MFVSDNFLRPELSQTEALYNDLLGRLQALPTSIGPAWKSLATEKRSSLFRPPEKKVYNFAAWVKLVLHQNRFSQVNHEKQKLGGLLPKGTHYNGTSKADVLEEV